MEAPPNRKGQDRFIGTPSAQVIGIILALFLGITFMLSGFYELFCLPMLVGVAMYVVPKMLGVKSTKTLLAAGAAYLVIISCVGALVVSPAYVDSYDNIGSLNEGDFTDADIILKGNGLYDITVEYNGSGTDVEFCYNDIMILYYSSAGMATPANRVAMTSSGTTYTASDVDLGDNKLEYFFFEAKSGSDTIDKTGMMIYRGSATDGDVTMMALEGNLYFIGINIMFIYFLVVIFSFFSRRSLENARERMEREGRLYPQGYGRCKECDALVLPGETCCRKCGAFIEKPEIITAAPVEEEMECSECGATVPANAEKCPKCGERFDADDDSGTV
ncbi:MAG: zinc ribbon domain-containing protein [Candidatus Methanomethylophilaceae archaeon]|nr:zinc ribbon domain-containing protein [Candidatus Methanomethylophilaceae archaeon]